MAVGFEVTELESVWVPVDRAVQGPAVPVVLAVVVEVSVGGDWMLDVVVG